MVDTVLPFLTQLKIIVDVSFHHNLFLGIQSGDFPLGIYHKHLIQERKKNQEKGKHKPKLHICLDLEFSICARAVPLFTLVTVRIITKHLHL